MGNFDSIRRGAAPVGRRGFLRVALGGAIAAGAGLLAWQGAAYSFGMPERAVAVPKPAQDEPAGGATVEHAVFAGGCFWGVQGVFQHVRGVRDAVSGYAGGAADTAHYEVVSEGGTGHAESVEVTFDPQQVSYGTLLRIFFSVVHDPTQLDRQGPDTGTQYRSALFPVDAAQRQVAQAYIAQLDAAHVYGKPIVTRLESGRSFYPAEAYHQNFLVRHPSYPYIVINDLPKVRALKQMYPKLYRPDPVLVRPS
ncbi:peptide-methionine (S)-S-oxide reductase MsrA [Candidimonas nitroreducens]|uniref:Peptide methionine sulfoxide reductase MsrA n=1 Tax=Candidimonas nitroreducens TaxID=683354 RepID=A0A225M094_9BURK|nr:peptide-methionine (S)-S-oxide reductase MsrA [Candidimonas nitroreducens]OWT53620.1 peptide-methionine (S)-S-oxide reductase [Candidimonas nitroreducens]